MERGTAESYRGFIRNWWRRDTSGRLIPDPGARKTTLRRNCTWLEAKQTAQEYNARHFPGALSRKAEFEKE